VTILPDSFEQSLGDKLESWKLSGLANTFLTSCESVQLATAYLQQFDPYPTTEPGIEFAKLIRESASSAPNMESAVDDLVSLLLHQLGFSLGHWLVRSRRAAPLRMSGHSVDAKADFVVLDLKSDSVQLAVIQDKSLLESQKGASITNAEAQLVAEGVAATQANLALGRKGRLMFLIRVLGIKFTFYYGILDDLANAVGEGFTVNAAIHSIYRFPSSGTGLDVSDQKQRTSIVEIFDKIKYYLLNKI